VYDHHSDRWKTDFRKFLVYRFDSECETYFQFQSIRIFAKSILPSQAPQSVSALPLRLEGAQDLPSPEMSSLVLARNNHAAFQKEFHLYAV